MSLDSAYRDLLREVLRDVVREELTAVRDDLLREHRTASSDSDTELLTPSEVAKLTNVHVGTVRNWVRCGQLVGSYAGRLLRIKRADLDRFLEAGDRSGSEPDVDVTASKILASVR